MASKTVAAIRAALLTHKGLSLTNTITALEQADLNTEQLVTLQEWIATTRERFNTAIRTEQVDH